MAEINQKTIYLFPSSIISSVLSVVCIIYNLYKHLLNTFEKHSEKQLNLGKYLSAPIDKKVKL
jgi:hypothetical protein